MSHTSCQRLRFETGPKGTVEVESCSKRFIDLDLLKSQVLRVLEDRLTVVEHNQLHSAKGRYEDKLIVAKHVECLPQAKKGRQEVISQERDESGKQPP